MEKKRTAYNQTQRRSNAPVQTRTRKKKRKKNNSLLYILLAFIIVTAGVVLSFSFFFKIDTITVRNNTRYDNAAVADSTGLNLGDNLFRFSKQKVIDKLLSQYSYFSSVKVLRRLPTQVIIDVTEETPIGVLIGGGENAVIGAKGKILETGQGLLPEGVVKVYGINFTGLKERDVLSGDELEKASMLAAFQAAVKETGFGYYDAVALSDVYNINLVYKDRIVIQLGSEAQLTYKLKALAVVFSDKVTDRVTDGWSGLLDASDPGTVRRSPIDVTPMIDGFYAMDGSRPPTIQTSGSSQPDTSQSDETSQTSVSQSGSGSQASSGSQSDDGSQSSSGQASGGGSASVASSLVPG